MPKRILFIGSSYTFYNGGINKHLEEMATKELASSSKSCIKYLAVHGYSLKDHYCNEKTLKAIHKGKWDYVILQEQSLTPVKDKAQFYFYARKLHKKIKETTSNANTALFMTWDRSDRGVTITELQDAYRELGRKLRVKVAPVGLAFARLLQIQASIAAGRKLDPLDRDDPDLHPTKYGTYLAACVFYATIFNKCPIGNPYSAELSSEETSLLQCIAAEETVNSWQSNT